MPCLILLPRNLIDVYKRQELNVVLGSLPYEGEDIKDAVKLSILVLLYDQYGIKEKDFFRAEFELVPAVKARDIGFCLLYTSCHF